MEGEELSQKTPYQRKKIDGFENYEIDTQGNVWSLNFGGPRRNGGERQLSLAVNNTGYYVTQLFKEGQGYSVRVHQLVAKAFLSNPNGLPDINHKDGNKLNNNVDNLEWVTTKENLRHFTNQLMREEGKYNISPLTTATIFCYDPETGELKDIYKNLQEVRTIFNAPQTSDKLSAVIQHRPFLSKGKWFYAKTWRGFHWASSLLSPEEVLKRMQDIPLPKEKSKKKKIYCYSPQTGSLIKIYGSMQEVLEEYNIPRSSCGIGNVLWGKQKTWKGFYWSYQELTSSEAKERATTHQVIRMITYKGETKSLVEWSKETNIPVSTLQYRYERGWTPDKILQGVKNEQS